MNHEKSTLLNIPSLEDLKLVSYGNVNMNRDFQKEIEAVGSVDFCGIELKKENGKYIEDDTYRMELFKYIDEMASCYGYSTEEWMEQCFDI